MRNLKKLTLQEELTRLQNITKYKTGGIILEAENDLSLDAFSDEGGEEPAAEEPVEEPIDDASLDTEPLDGEDGTDLAPEDGGDIELEVSDLVRGIEDANNKADTVQMNIQNSTQRMDQLLNQVAGLESKLNVMDALLARVDDLTMSVEKMRPPTEGERKEALKQNSYPYNTGVTGDEDVEKTATDLEKRKHKLSFQDIMNDFNHEDVSRSFDIEDPIDKELDDKIRPYRL